MAHRFCLFVDILGFKHLVRDGDGMLSFVSTQFASSTGLEEFLKWEQETGRIPIVHQFTVFQHLLAEQVRWALSITEITSIAFSDSAYVTFSDRGTAIFFCQRLMRRLIQLEVPVRMGLGYGSFRAVRFSSDFDPNSHNSVNAAEFLGTAVINAYETESSGHAGMRILLHPDLPFKGDDREDFISAGQPYKPPSIVTNELSYLLRARDDMHPADQTGATFATNTNWSIEDSVRTMRGRADPNVHFQYDATLESLARQRAHCGTDLAP